MELMMTSIAHCCDLVRAAGMTHIPEGVCHKITVAAVRGLHYLKAGMPRDMSVVHRDVKPSNMLLGYDGNVKLCDFGISKIRSVGDPSFVESWAGAALYMPPEQYGDGQRGAVAVWRVHARRGLPAY